MQLFYSPDVSLNNTFIIEGQEHVHMTKALRKSVGDLVNVTNGKGELFSCEIVATTKKHTTLANAQLKEKVAKNNKLCLAVAPTKLMNRYEWMLEKGVEMGVVEWLPMFTFHSERRKIKQEKLQLQALGAMKQSLQFWKPTVNEASSFKALLHHGQQYDQKYIAYCDEHKVQLKEVLSPQSNAIVLIGPEGGFSKEEVKEAENMGFRSISLGKNRLRTETAAIFVASLYYSLL